MFIIHIYCHRSDMVLLGQGPVACTDWVMPDLLPPLIFFPTNEYQEAGLCIPYQPSWVLLGLICKTIYPLDGHQLYSPSLLLILNLPLLSITHSHTNP